MACTTASTNSCFYLCLLSLNRGRADLRRTMQDSAREIAAKWITDFSDAVRKGNVQSLCELFLVDGWLRNSLIFSWDVRSLEGREKIRAYLSDGDGGGGSGSGAGTRTQTGDEVVGFGLFGLVGEQTNREREGGSVKERADVWFERVSGLV